MNTSTNMNNNTKEVNNMKYRITAVNGERLDPWHYASLCPVCGKHFIIDTDFDSLDGDTDTWFITSPRCGLCATRFRPLYGAVIPEFGWFDGHYDCVTGKYIAACDGLSKDFVYYPAAVVHAAYAKLRIIDTEYETMLEEMRKSDYEELADSDWPF